MQTLTTLGGSGLRVSRLALGTMTFGTETGWGADRATAGRILDRYLDAGGNFVDTADLYTGGTSERWLGEMIRERGIRDRVVLATKFGFSADAANPNAGGNGRKNILRAVEGSLERLGTDYIDLYFLHCWDRVTPPEEVMRTFDDLVRAGKVRHVGLSNVPAWYASRAQTIAEARGYEALCSLQLEYSLAEREIENEHLPLGLRYGMSLVAWSPLSSGLLSGKYRRGEGGRVEAVKGSGNPAFEKVAAPKNAAIVEALEGVADEVGRSMAQVAIHWVLRRSGVGAVLLGARTEAQLEDNLGALDFELSPELVARLDDVSAPAERYPYLFFSEAMQRGVHGAKPISTAPSPTFGFARWSNEA